MNILLSYPNSGRTWVSSVLSESGVNINLSHLGSHIEDAKIIEKYLKKYPNKFCDDNVLILTRELKDQLVSNFCQMKYRLRLYNGEISDFIRDKKYGAENILHFNDLLNSIYTCKSKLIVAYEDLIANPEFNFKKILLFYGVEVDNKKLNSVIEFYSFENMKTREYEKKENILWYSSTKINIPESFKCRKGIVGGYIDYMSNEDIYYCNELTNQYNNFN